MYIYIYIQYIYIQNIGETYRIAENLMNIPFMRWFSKIWASLGPSQPSLGGLGVLDRGHRVEFQHRGLYPGSAGDQATQDSTALLEYMVRPGH